MLSNKIKVSKSNTTQHMLNSLNGYVIKVDYFDQEGSKNFEDNIPLKYIFDPDLKLPDTDIDLNYV